MFVVMPSPSKPGLCLVPGHDMRGKLRSNIKPHATTRWLCYLQPHTPTKKTGGSRGSSSHNPRPGCPRRLRGRRRRHPPLRPGLDVPRHHAPPGPRPSQGRQIDTLGAGVLLGQPGCHNAPAVRRRRRGRRDGGGGRGGGGSLGRRGRGRGSGAASALEGLGVLLDGGDVGLVVDEEADGPADGLRVVLV